MRAQEGRAGMWKPGNIGTMGKMQCSVVSCVLTVAVVVASAVSGYAVSSDGNDITGDGSAGAPFSSLFGCFGAPAEAGDRVVLRDGCW